MATLPSATTDLVTLTVKPFAHAKQPFVVERTFDLSTLLSAVVANADVVNLMGLPANHSVIAASLTTVTAGTKDATAFTLQLRFGTTAITAALDATAAGISVGGNATYGLPITTGTSATHLNLLAAVTGGNAVATKNPVVKVCLLVCDMA